MSIYSRHVTVLAASSPLPSIINMLQGKGDLLCAPLPWRTISRPAPCHGQFVTVGGVRPYEKLNARSASSSGTFSISLVSFLACPLVPEISRRRPVAS
jgi:hypothetical protein